MAVRTTVQPKFAIKMIVIAIVCLVFGVWGLYDYFIHIPRKQHLYAQWTVLDAAKTALETTRGSESLEERYETAIRMTETALENIVRRRCEQLDIEFRPIDDPANAPWWSMLMLQTADQPPEISPETAQGPAAREPIRIAESLRSVSAAEKSWLQRTLTVRPDRWTWFRNLFRIRQGLAFGRTAPKPEDRPLAEPAKSAYEFVKTGLDKTGDVTPPSKFDHVMQWGFILCLPFAPYFLWVYLRTRRRVYVLDDDGTFRYPGGELSRDQISDIDMDRWMSKSIAYVVSSTGERVKLDDYIFRNTHLIVGALASEMYPEKWDAEAKLRKTSEDPELTAALSDETHDNDSPPETDETPVESGDAASDRS